MSEDGIMLMPNDDKVKLSTNKKKGVDKNVAENKKNQ